VETIFLICAGLGGAMLAAQFLLSLLGVGGEHDGIGDHADAGETGGHDGADGADSHDSAASHFLGLLTFRTISAGLTFFGLGGMAAAGSGLALVLQAAVALACGLAAIYLVALLMKSLHRLKADGTVRLEKAVGQTGTVYLRIPGQLAGPGKVTLVLNHRSLEFEALTAGDELPTGSKVVVLRVVGPDAVEVTSAPALASVETRTHA
jgi:hypothetical protein